MVPFQKIELRKMRDFSSKFNATFEFIRQNIKILLTSMLFISAPFYILGMVFLAYYQNFVLQGNPSFGGDSTAALGYVGNMFRYIFVFYFFIGVGYLLNVAIVYNIMRLYDQKTDVHDITVGEVWNLAKKDIGKLLVAGLLIAVVCAVGFVMLFIPGIYLAIVLSLIMPILIFEHKSVGDAFSRCFFLIKDKWWSTFGLLFIASMLQIVMGLVFNIPTYIFTFLVTFHRAKSEMMDAPLWEKTALLLSTCISATGAALLGCVGLIALAFQYFNLVERREAQGLMNRMETIGLPESPTVDPLETY